MRQQPLFVAPDPLWTRSETIRAFAEREQRRLFDNPDKSYSLEGDARRFWVTVVRSEGHWVYAVFIDTD